MSKKWYDKTNREYEKLPNKVIKKTFHTYGDSHGSTHGGWGKIFIEGLHININWLGAKLMYRFAEDKKKIIKNINPDDIICFSFGEIDCRCHIHKFEPDWVGTINSLVEGYFHTININVESHNPSLIYIYNIVPPIEREKPENLRLKGKSALPALGTDEDRKKYTLYMNSKLKELSHKYGYIFLDVYNKYSDDNGFLLPTLSDNNCHIKDPTYITEFLKKKLK
jgi:hypothetical protein